MNNLDLRNKVFELQIKLNKLVDTEDLNTDRILEVSRELDSLIDEMYMVEKKCKA